MQQCEGLCTSSSENYPLPIYGGSMTHTSLVYLRTAGRWKNETINHSRVGL
jgi:hypothetical protein